MEVKCEHPENTHSPIVLTLSGMMIEVKEEQPENALSSIAVILLGIEKLVSFFPAG